MKKVRLDQLVFDRLAENERSFCKTCKEGFKKPDMERIVIDTDGKNEQQPGSFLPLYRDHGSSGPGRVQRRV